MISNQTIPAASTITIDMTGTLSQGQYGNFYFVFKNESKSYTFVENIKPVEQGNYLALQIGGDGCFMYDQGQSQRRTRGGQYFGLVVV